MDTAIYDAYVKILDHELVPALGCTEPIAIAYAAAKAREVLGCFPESLEMRCSGNIIKNVKGVTVPNAGGMKGIDVAAVLGTVGGDASRELEVLESITEQDIEKTKRLVDEGFCCCTLQEGVENLYIVAKAISKGHYAEITIINRHTFITKIVKDAEVLYEHAVSEKSPDYVDKSLLNVKGILEFADEVRIEDVKEILDRQIEMNTAISNEGMEKSYGAMVGQTLISLYGDDVKVRARARAAAGSDARMGGCSFPVVINSGSGNQGMTVSLPVIEYAEALGVSREKLYRALVVSNLVSIHQKKYIGSLSAYCGAVSAASGSGAGIAYLHDADYEVISLTIINTIANVGGIVCDGAKPSCAAKIASSVEAAILAYALAKEKRTFLSGEGIVKEDVERTIRSIGYIGRVGMCQTDTEILNVMIDRVNIDEE